jgi:hypothetical protein
VPEPSVEPAPPPAPGIVAPPPAEKHGSRKEHRAKVRHDAAEPAAPSAVAAPPPAVVEEQREQREQRETRPIPVKKSDRRALDTDVFDDNKKREIDRDPWKP